MAGFLLLSLLTGCRDVRGALRMYGYEELVPPSTWMVPGTVVYRQPGKEFKVGLVCNAERNLGPDFKPYESETIARALKKEKNFNIHLDLDIASLVQIDSKLEHISKINVQLTNVHLFELSDWQVAAYVEKRDPACARAIQARLARGYRVTIISSALQADATYQVEWNSTAMLTVKSKVDAMKALAADFGISATSVTTTGFSANKLIWGVKDDEFLLLSSVQPQL